MQFDIWEIVDGSHELRDDLYAETEKEAQEIVREINSNLAANGVPFSYSHVYYIKDNDTKNELV
jgi:hypothetical protein